MQEGQAAQLRCLLVGGGRGRLKPHRQVGNRPVNGGEGCCWHRRAWHDTRGLRIELYSKNCRSPSITGMQRSGRRGEVGR